jgi:putative ABC transport system ATP-binding protein
VLSVVENVELPLLIGRRKISPAEARERALHFIEKVGLTKHAAHRPDELSGGQMQRVAIARALVTQPRIVLADEPTANLDSVTTAMIVDIMHKLNQEEKVTFVLATHDSRVLKFASRVIEIEDGLLKTAQAA